MAETNRRRLVDALLDRYEGRSLAEQADITVKDSPNTVFQLLQLAMLASVRVDPDTAAETFQAFRDRGWTTVKHLHDADHDERVGVLRTAGYGDADADKVSRMMGDAAAHLLDQYGARLGDLRDAAGRDPAGIRAELKRFVAVDDAVVDAFFRDVQLLWGELRPFADKQALDAASRLGLGDDPQDLERVAGDDDELVKLVDALVRIRHDDGYDDVRERAAAG